MLYSSNGLVELGIWGLRKWRGAQCLTELSLPAPLPRHFLDTSQTLPRHFPDTSSTLPRHFPDTSQTLPRHFLGAQCLTELSLKDAAEPTATYLYALSKAPQLARFANILLVSSAEDRYVPHHSARIQLCHEVHL